MPTFNHGNYINHAITSVKNQDYQNWELIIIDNYSTDKTEEKVKNFEDARIRYEKFRNNGVIAASRNFGIKLSTGDLIAFLDSDDEWTSKKLSTCIRELVKSNADLIYHQMNIKKISTLPYIRRMTKHRKLTHPSYYDLLENGNPIINSSVVMKKSIRESVGLLNEDFDYFAWEDFDYWIRISKSGFKLQLINEPLGYYLVGVNNTSSSSRRLLINRAIKKHYFEDNNKPTWMIFSDLKSYCNLLESKYALKEFKNLIQTKDVPIGTILKGVILLIQTLTRIR